MPTDPVDTTSGEESSLWAAMLTGTDDAMLGDVVSDSPIDAEGKRLYFESNETRAKNAATRPEKTRMQLCPICCSPCGNATKRCKTCTFVFKQFAGPRYQGKVTVMRDTGANAINSKQIYLAAVERIKAAYYRQVDVKRVQMALLSVHRNPCSILDLYVFDPHTSADRLHCIPADKVQMVLNHTDGLSPLFACLAPGQRIKAVWFREATLPEVSKGIEHTIENHEQSDSTTVYGFVVKASHPACRLIIPAKHNHQFYSMVPIHTDGLLLVRLN
jgi:hypothetical protein